MRTLIVGAGALGGLLAARLRSAGAPVWLATRTESSASQLLSAGLHVSGPDGLVEAAASPVAPLDNYRSTPPFDLVVLATKARDAIDAAPAAVSLLTHGGALLPLQNGGVARILAASLGQARVLGGLSNLGAAMSAPGRYAQTNRGYLLLGELGGGESARAEAVQAFLSQGVEARRTANLDGAIWSKLIINCAVTTIGAIAGMTMREYVVLDPARQLFQLAYSEALAVALASGVRPERLAVAPVPPGWNGRIVRSSAYDTWLDEVVAFYGDIKPSMQQDFERVRPTEIDFINGYVVECGRQWDTPTPANAAIVRAVRAVTAGERTPGPWLLEESLAECDG